MAHVEDASDVWWWHNDRKMSFTTSGSKLPLLFPFAVNPVLEIFWAIRSGQFHGFHINKSSVAVYGIKKERS